MASQDPRGAAERWGGGGAGPQGGGAGPAGGSTGSGGTRTYRSLPTTAPGQTVPGAREETGYGAQVGYGPYGDKMARTPESLAAMQSRVKQYNTDSIGDVLLGMMGIHKRKPGTDRMYNSPDVERVWDPIETALGIGGIFNPALNAVSKLYTVTKMLTGFEGAAVPLNEQQGPYLGAPSKALAGQALGNPAVPGADGRPTLPAGNGGDRPAPAPIPAAAMSGTAGQLRTDAPTLDNAGIAAPFQALLSPSGRGRLGNISLLGAPSGGL